MSSEKKAIYRKTLAKNRKALHDFSILETIEMGISLKGSEVKPTRAGKINLSGSYAFINLKGEVFVKGMHIGPYDQASYMGHEAICDRKLLAKRKEIAKIATKLKKGGLTLIPLEVYVKNRWIKMAIGLARGKRKADQREDIKKRDTEREMSRYLKQDQKN